MASCERKKQVLWAEWLREKLLAPVPHRHVVFTIPRLLRPLFRRRRDLLSELARAGAEAVAQLVRGRLGRKTRPRVVVAVAKSRCPTPARSGSISPTRRPRFGTKSQGQAHETTHAHIVAEELGISAAHVELRKETPRQPRMVWAPTPAD
jgi:hypothetical protein